MTIVHARSVSTSGTSSTCARYIMLSTIASSPSHCLCTSRTGLECVWVGASRNLENIEELRPCKWLIALFIQYGVHSLGLLPASVREDTDEAELGTCSSTFPTYLCASWLDFLVVCFVLLPAILWRRRGRFRFPGRWAGVKCWNMSNALTLGAFYLSCTVLCSVFCGGATAM